VAAASTVKWLRVRARIGMISPFASGWRRRR
jgi:hypothetical protein